MSTETVLVPVRSGITRTACATALLLTLTACGSSGGDSDTGSGSSPGGSENSSSSAGAGPGSGNSGSDAGTDSRPNNSEVDEQNNIGADTSAPPAGSSGPGEVPGEVSTDNVVLLGDSLWKTDGTAEGTVSVQDSISSVVAYYYGITEFNGEFYFQATDNVHGFELWKTNGTAAGTVLIKDINPGARSSFDYRFSDFTVFNGALYFHANDGVSGAELWKTDGSAAGTVLVKDINPAAGVSSNPTDFTVFNNALYFSATDSAGTKLWKTDGSSAGTTEISDAPIATGTSFLPDDYSRGFPVFNGALYFRSGGLWKTDGSAAAPVENEDISSPGWLDTYLYNGFTVFNDMLYVVVEDSGYGREIWKTDATAASTVLLKDINTENGGRRSDYQFNEFTVFNGALYFQSKDNVNGHRLWKTDGTADGTVLVKSFGLGSPASALTVYNGGLYFRNASGLWKTDGSADGTQLFKAI